jgi:hypothetical protein
VFLQVKVPQKKWKQKSCQTRCDSASGNKKRKKRKGGLAKVVKQDVIQLIHVLQQWKQKKVEK